MAGIKEGGSKNIMRSSSQRWASLFRGLGYLATVVVLAGCWWLERDNRRLSDYNRKLLTAQAELFATAARPIIIRGFSIPIADHADLIEEHRGVGVAAPRQLILIFRGSCPACDRQIPYWRQFLADGSLRNMEVWLVQAGEDPGELRSLIEVITDRKLPYRRMRIRSALPFTAATGISGAPVTIVTSGVGPESLVEFVEPGLADLSRLEIIFENPRTTEAAIGARILPFGQINPL